MSGSQDKGFQSYFEPLASILAAPDADFGPMGAAGKLLRQLAPEQRLRPSPTSPTKIPTSGWDLGPVKPGSFQAGWAPNPPIPTVNPSTGLQQFNLKDAQMSGTQGPMQGMPPGGAPQMGGGAPPQIPPQVLQMLMQRMQQQGGQQGMPGGGGPMPQAPQQQGQMPPPGAGQPMAPPGAAGGAPGGPPPGGPSPMGQPHMTPAQMASQGRFGDQVVAHLTPGEVQVPPQVQTPQLMHMLQQAFAKAGVSPQQFTAGSPQSSHNPATGAPEYSLLAALLPILGGAAGSFIPGVGTGIGAAIGGGLGGAAGGALDHGGAANILASGLGGAAGGYLSGGGLNAGSAPMQGPTATGAALDASPFGGAGAPSAMGATKMGFGAGLGSAVGGMLAPPQQSNSSGLPSGFNNPLPPLNPNFNSLLGNNQSSQASFAGYNPYTAATGHPFNAYSPTGNGA